MEKEIRESTSRKTFNPQKKYFKMQLKWKDEIYQNFRASLKGFYF